jgi:hypothetical protein
MNLRHAASPVAVGIERAKPGPPTQSLRIDSAHATVGMARGAPRAHLAPATIALLLKHVEKPR